MITGPCSGDEDWDRDVDTFGGAVERARRVLVQPEVGSGWDSPSILPHLSVGALAAHLLGVLRACEKRLDEPALVGTAVTDAAQGYSIARLGTADDLAQAPFAVVREASNRLAGIGHAAVVAGYDEASGRLLERLARTAPDDLVLAPGGLGALRIRDYLHTRVVELVVHADDLAESAGAVVDDVDEVAGDLVRDFLIRSVRHHLGEGEFLRALAGRRPTDALRAL